LSDSSSTYHSEHLAVIKSLTDVESVVLIVDVPSGTALTRALFSACFDALSVNPSELSSSVCHNLTALLVTVVNEAENLPDEVIDIVLAQFLRADPRSRFSKGRKQAAPVDANQATLELKEVPPAYTMAQDICLATVDRMSRYVLRYFSSILADTALALSERAPKKSSEDGEDDEAGPRAPSEEELAEWQKAHLLLRELWRAAHGVLQQIIPQMEIELMTDNLHIRLMAVEALGGMIAGVGAAGPPPPPTLDPAAYPSESVRTQPVERSYHFLLTPASAISFISRHPETYDAFLGRRRDKSPVIRAAFAMWVGRIILFDVGGKGFNSEKQRTELLDYFSESLGDIEDKVRLAALKVLEEYPYSDVVSKLGEHGPITQAGSILWRVAERVKDRKLAVSLTAIPLLAKWWGVAAGAIAAGDGNVKELLGNIPDVLIGAYFVQERELHHAVDKATYESLLPLTFPPRVPGAASETSSNSGESEPEHNRLRAERILLLIDALSVKTRGAFFAKQTQQPRFAKYVGYYLTLCEDYNGGVTNQRARQGVNSPARNTQSPSRAARSPGGKDAPGKDPKSQLLLLIETALLGQFPDKQRAKDDLMKFAKHHDRRCYALIRFTWAAQSDWARVRKSIKEICRRVEDNQPAVLNTITHMLWRCSLLMYNQSNLPSFFHFARTNEKGLSVAAHEIIKEISGVQGQVFHTILKQQCETLIADKPLVGKPHGPGVVQDLKACSRFSVNYPQRVPNDPGLSDALMAYVTLGTPRAAKYAACILLTGSPKKDAFADDIYRSSAAGFDVNNSRYVSKLAALSQLMRYSPSALKPEQVDTVVDIAINRVLLRSRGAVSTPEALDKTWTDEPDEDVQGKCWALKILVNRLRTLPLADDVSTVAETLFGFLNSIIAKDGQMDESPVPPAHAGHLLRTAAISLLKLCRQDRYNKALQPEMFNRLSITAQHHFFEVRGMFVKKIMKHLSKNRLPKRFHTILYLVAYEPQVAMKAVVENWVRSRGQALSKDKRASLEISIVRLISLLAHHPDFIVDTPADIRETYTQMIQYFIFFLKTTATLDNISLVYFFAQQIKKVVDGIDNSSTNIWALSDLAQAVIRKLVEQQRWTLNACSEQVSLPVAIFVHMPSAKAAEASKICLPQDIVENLDPLLEEGLEVLKPKPKKRARRVPAPATKRARDASDSKEDKPPAKKARGSKAATAKGKGKAKATSDDEDDIEMDDEASSPLSDQRRSGRTRRTKNYKESDDEEEDDDLPVKQSRATGAREGRWSALAESSAAAAARAAPSDSEMDTD
jgi:sister-chromatid-cohesion protein PDS5